MRVRALLSLLVLIACASPSEARRRYRPLTAYDRYQLVKRSAYVAPDGTVEFRLSPFVHWEYGSSVFRLGRDRDFREEKRAFLDETFEERAKMGEVFRHRAARASLQELPWRARAIWCDRSRSLDERKRLLYMLWEDAAEPEDAELGEYGQQARAIVERFVKMNVPDGSPEAYSLAELAALNVGRGRSPHFDPYAPGAGAIAEIVPEPVHVDEPERETAPPAPEPSPEVIAKVARALVLAPVERRARLFVAWDDAAANHADADAAYVARWLPRQRYRSDELIRYAALRGDDAFTRAAQ
jgi:hypothetical protein